MTYRIGTLIVNVLVGTATAALVVFTIAFSWVLIEAFRLTSFNMSLSGTSPGQVTTDFDIYAFISIEACFIGILIGAGYYVFKKALQKNVIEVAVD